jgi:hypothetical protein
LRNVRLLQQGSIFCAPVSPVMDGQRQPGATVAATCLNIPLRAAEADHLASHRLVRQGTMTTCTRVLQALADCQKKHPREPYVCQHLQRAAGWCLFRVACPDEGTWEPRAVLLQPRRRLATAAACATLDSCRWAPPPCESTPWCTYAVDALEACAGASSSRPPLAGPPAIPPRCHQQVRCCCLASNRQRQVGL